MFKDFKSSPNFVLLLCWLAYSSIYIGRLNLSIASPLMESTGVINKVGLGMMGSLFFFTYALGQLFNGYAGDRINSKTMVVIGLFAAAICNISIAFLPGYTLLLLLWAVNGYAQSMLWGPSLGIVSSAFCDRTRNKAASILSTSVAAGSIVGTAIALFLAGQYGISPTFLIPGIILALLGIAVIIFLKDTKNIQKQTHAKYISIKNVFIHKDVRSMLIPAAAHGIVKDSINIWMPLYFVDIYNIDIRAIALYVFIIPVIGMLGRLFFGPMYRLCGHNEKKTSAVCFCICILSLLPLVLPMEKPIWLATLLISIVSFSVSMINTAILAIFPLNFKDTGNVSSISGVMDFTTYAGAGASTIVSGFLIKNAGYPAMLSLWLIVCILSVIMLYLKNQNISKTIKGF